MSRNSRPAYIERRIARPGWHGGTMASEVKPMRNFGYLVRWEIGRHWYEDYFNSHDFKLAESRFHNLQINLPGSEVQLVQLGHLKTDRIVLGYRAGR